MPHIQERSFIHEKTIKYDIKEITSVVDKLHIWQADSKHKFTFPTPDFLTQC